MYINGTCKFLSSELIGVFIKNNTFKKSFYNCNVYVKFELSDKYK